MPVRIPTGSDQLLSARLFEKQATRFITIYNEPNPALDIWNGRVRDSVNLNKIVTKEL